MTTDNVLQELASLIQQRNTIDKKIAATIGRPAHPGHIGEFVAARIFDIDLMESAVHKGFDGYFTDGPLSGKSVNVKKYAINQALLDMTLNDPPDFYLVLTGPRKAAASSRGTTQPWVIKSVFLFDARELTQELQERRIKIGVATSVRGHYWDKAEIYPSANNRALILNPKQRSMIEMFDDPTGP